MSHCLGALNPSSLKTAGICFRCANLHGTGGSIDGRAHRAEGGVYVCADFVAHSQSSGSTTPEANSASSLSSSAATACTDHS